MHELENMQHYDLLNRTSRNPQKPSETASRLRPVAQQRHQTRSYAHCAKGGHDLHKRCILHLRVKDEVVSL